MKKNLYGFGTLLLILAAALACALVGTAVGYTIIALWGVIGKVVLTIVLVLGFVGLMTKSWARLTRR